MGMRNSNSGKKLVCHLFVTCYGINNGFKNRRKEFRSHFHKLTKRGTDSLGLKLYYDGLMNMTYLKNLIRN